MLNKGKRDASNGLIATIHFVVAGFLLPFIIITVISYIIRLFFDETLFILGAGLIIGPLSIWLGVLYTAKFINKHYTINDVSKIIKLATIYYVVFYILLFIISGGNFYSIAPAVIGVFVFYFTSKKYIKMSEQQTSQNYSEPEDGAS